MKTLNDIVKQFDEILLNYSNDTEKINSEISKIDDEIAATKVKLDQAEKDINRAEFEKASSELLTAERTKAMFEDRLSKLANMPLISKNEYLNHIKLIKSIGDNEQQKILDEAKELLQKLKKLSDKSGKLIGETQKVLDTLHFEIAKDYNPYKYNDFGGMMFFKPEYKITNKVILNGLTTNLFDPGSQVIRLIEENKTDD